MRPPGPVPGTCCSGIPKASARRRVAGATSGSSPADREGAGASAGTGSAWSWIPATSNSINTAPTATIPPTSPWTASTLPLTGELMSNAALSVMISARFSSSATSSPGLTCKATSSASATPSPTSGSRKLKCPIVSPPSRARALRQCVPDPRNSPIRRYADTAYPTPRRVGSAP
jgi:hypothetical protein